MQCRYHQSVFGPVGGGLADKNTFQGQNVEPKRSDLNFTDVVHFLRERSQAGHGDDDIKWLAMRASQHGWI